MEDLASAFGQLFRLEVDSAGLDPEKYQYEDDMDGSENASEGDSSDDKFDVSRFPITNKQILIPVSSFTPNTSNILQIPSLVPYSIE